MWAVASGSVFDEPFSDWERTFHALTRFADAVDEVSWAAPTTLPKDFGQPCTPAITHTGSPPPPPMAGVTREKQWCKVDTVSSFS